MKRLFLLMTILPLLLAAPLPAVAADKAVSTMAKILLHLNHYPSDAEKEQLAAITRDKSATTGERTLAGALMRMRHRVEGEDADRLNDLLHVSNTHPDVGELARIMLAIEHHPDAAQKEQLRKLANQ